MQFSTLYRLNLRHIHLVYIFYTSHIHFQCRGLNYLIYYEYFVKSHEQSILTLEKSSPVDPTVARGSGHIRLQRFECCFEGGARGAVPTIPIGFEGPDTTTPDSWKKFPCWPDYCQVIGTHFVSIVLVAAKWKKVTECTLLGQADRSPWHRTTSTGPLKAELKQSSQQANFFQESRWAARDFSQNIRNI